MLSDQHVAVLDRLSQGQTAVMASLRLQAREAQQEEAGAGT